MLIEYSKNSVTSFELPLRDSLCVCAPSDDDDVFAVALDDLADEDFAVEDDDLATAAADLVVEDDGFRSEGILSNVTVLFALVES